MPSYKKILDTFLFSENEIHLEKFHVDRVFETYQFLKTPVNRSEIENIYAGIKKQLVCEISSENSSENSGTNTLVRVTLDPVRPHKHTVEVKTPESLSTPVRLVLTEALQPFSEVTQYKFADRKEWDLLFNSRPEGSDDVLLVRNGTVIETSRFNLFLHDRKNNVVLTPTLKSGCLNGVYRRHALSQGYVELPEAGKVAVKEKDFTLEDLQDCQLYVANSVRGILPALV